MLIHAKIAKLQLEMEMGDTKPLVRDILCGCRDGDWAQNAKTLAVHVRNPEIFQSRSSYQFPSRYTVNVWVKAWTNWATVTFS